MATRDELYTALRNADAAGDTEGAGKLAAYIQSLPTADAPTQPQAAPPVAPAPNAPQVQTQPTFTEQLKHALLLRTRGLVTGATATGSMLADPMYAAYNLATGSHHQLPSAALQDMLTRTGLPVANTPGEKVADFATQMVGGAALDPAAAAMMARIPPRPLPTAAQLAEKAQTIQEGQALGLKTTPAQTQAGVGSRTLELISGRGRTQQMADAANTETAGNISRRVLNLPPDAPLNAATIENVVDRAYTAGYEPVKQAGTITTGRVYRQALNDAMNQFQGASRSFPAAAKADVANLINSYRVKSFDAGDAIEATKSLRAEASAAMKDTTTQALGKAKYAVANALENNIELVLQSQGKPGVAMLQDFRDARKTIAQARVIGDAIVEGTGAVNPGVFGAALNAGKPLTGDLRTLGKMANTAPTNMRFTTASPSLFTTPESMWMGANAAIPGLHSPTGALPIARLLARHAMLTGPYQRAFMHPVTEPGVMERMLANPQSLNALPAGLEQLFGGGE